MVTYFVRMRQYHMTPANGAMPVHTFTTYCVYLQLLLLPDVLPVNA
jgi:hypothetical protein